MAEGDELENKEANKKKTRPSFKNVKEPIHGKGDVVMKMITPRDIEKESDSKKKAKEK